MTGNLKAFALALMAMLAFSAVAAAAAPAAEQGLLTSENGNNVTLTASETGVNVNGLTFFGAALRCPGSTYAGHRVLTVAETEEEKDHQFLQPGDTDITVTPNYVNCATESALGELPTTFDLTGCDFVFHLGKTTGEVEGTYGITVDIVCPSEKHIDITMTSGGSTICKITITAQTGLTGLHATNTPGSEDFDIEGTIHNIGPIHREGTCLLDGKGSTTTEGTAHADMTVQAHDEELEPEGVTISD